MKDALGHGSDTRGGVAAHQTGVETATYNSDAGTIIAAANAAGHKFSKDDKRAMNEMEFNQTQFLNKIRGNIHTYKEPFPGIGKAENSRQIQNHMRASNALQRKYGRVK